MTSKKMKYASIAGVGLMTMSLIACASPDEQQGYIGDTFETQQAMQNNGIQQIDQTQFAEKCEEYELQPDGSYLCDSSDNDDNSGGSGIVGMFWFFNGHTYTSQSAMVGSSDYKKHNLKTGTSIPAKTKNKINNPNTEVRNSSESKNNSKTNTGGSNNPKNGSSKSSSGKSSGFGGGARGGSSGGS